MSSRLSLRRAYRRRRRVRSTTTSSVWKTASGFAMLTRNRCPSAATSNDRMSRGSTWNRRVGRAARALPEGPGESDTAVNVPDGST